MPEQRNYRLAIWPLPDSDELQSGIVQMTQGLGAPSSPEGAINEAIFDFTTKPGSAAKAVEGIIDQQRTIASNKQELISKIIKPMKGLDDKPPSPGTRSPAEIYADTVIAKITADSSIPEDAAIAMILQVWPAWSGRYTWDTFLNFISKAAKTFSNPQDVLEWSKKLFESMQDGAPVFTPEYIMNVALDAINTGNFTKYQNLLISLPFYKSIWSKTPIDPNDFSKSVSQVATVMELTRTPTEDMALAIRNMKAQNELTTAFEIFYRSFLAWFMETNILELENAKKEIKDRTFDAGAFIQNLIRVEMKKKGLVDRITKGLEGLDALGIDLNSKRRKGSSKLFKTILAAGASAGASGSGASGSGTSSTTTSTTSSGTLSPAEQAARAAGNLITRKSALIEQRQRVIENNLKQINNISEQKTKGLSGDLGLFSSLVTSGNVVKKIDETLREINKQKEEINLVISESKKWISNPVSGSEQLSAQSDTISLNEMKFTAMLQDLEAIKQDLEIQRKVLPKELEYFELKEEYDTNKAQLDAPISALMVNNLKTTTDRSGKTKTINTRATRPIAIKNTWETGKKIVNLLMQISQALQASTGHGPMGESMAKNASNYYKAAVKQEVENNKMLMENLAKTGLGGGQVNYTPVAVGKK